MPGARDGPATAPGAQAPPPSALASPLPAPVRRLLFADGACSRLMDVLTGGPFLAGLALLVGASNAMLGLLAALPFLAQAAQLPSLALLLRATDRRRIVVVAAGAGRLLLAAIAVLLWFAPGLLTPVVLLALLAASALLTVTATAAWNWWMRDLLPVADLGRFFGSRLRSTTAIALVALLLAGWSLDAFANQGQEARGYAVLFGAGALAGLVGVAVLHRTPHGPPPPSPPAAASWRLLGDALRRPETRRTLAALASVSAAVTFALPFAAVFLLRVLGFSYAAVAALTIVSNLGYMAGLRGWGHLADRTGERGVLLVAMGLLTTCMLAWALSGGTGSWAMLAWMAALHFATGFALGGADLGATNLMLKTAPAHHAPAHLAAIGFGRAALAGLGTVAAGFLWQGMGATSLWATNLGPLDWSLRGFQVLCLLAAGLGVASLAALRVVPEPRRVPMRDVALTMRREVQQMSSVAGIRAFIHAISYSVELFAAPFAARSRSRPARPPDGAPPPPPVAPATPDPPSPSP